MIKLDLNGSAVMVNAQDDRDSCYVLRMVGIEAETYTFARVD